MFLLCGRKCRPTLRELHIAIKLQNSFNITKQLQEHNHI